MKKLNNKGSINCQIMTEMKINTRRYRKSLHGDTKHLGATVFVGLIGFVVTEFFFVGFLGLMGGFIGLFLWGTAAFAWAFAMGKRRNLWQYKFEDNPVRVLEYKKEILFNTNDLYSIVGLQKSENEPACLNFAGAIEFANAHSTNLATWLKDAFACYRFNSHTPLNLKIDNNWSNVLDKRIWAQ